MWKIVSGILVGIALVVAGAVYAQQRVQYDAAVGSVDGTAISPSSLTVTGATTLGTSTTLGGDLFTAGYDVANNVALTGDNGGAAAMLSLGGNSSPFATTAAKKIGGATEIRGGLGTKNATLTRANCGTATITIGWTNTDGVAVTQPFIEATHWARGATDTDSAVALAAAITAGTGGASTPVGHTTAESMSATNVAGVVGLVPTPGKLLSLTFTGDGVGTCAAEVDGADGVIYSPRGISMGTIAAGTSGGCLLGGSVLGVNGTVAYAGDCSSAGSLQSSGSMLAGTTLVVGTTMQFYLKSFVTSPATGIVLFTNASAGANMAYSFPKTITTADDAGGTHAATTINPADANYIIAECNDTQGCTATITETSAAAGMSSTIMCAGTGAHTDFADSGGVLELTGALVCAPLMSMLITYNGTAWVEHSRSGAL